MYSVVVKFSNEVDFRALPFFRSAVIASLQEKNILYHNHDKKGLRYAYPLIQYKLVGKKAVVMAIGEGVDIISNLLNANSFTYQIGKKSVDMHLESVDMYENNIIVENEKNFNYTLSSWLPLNTQNYTQYQNTESLIERVKILEKVLTGNILSFLKGIGCYLDAQVYVQIIAIDDQHILGYKGMKMIAFDIRFKTNIQLPLYIGLGKHVSVGFGIVKNIK